MILYNFDAADAQNFPKPSLDTVASFSAAELTWANVQASGFSTSSNSSNAYPNASGMRNWFASQMIATQQVDSTTPYLEIVLNPEMDRAVQVDGVGFGARTLADPADKFTFPGPERYELRTSLDGFSSSVASGSFNLQQGDHNWWYWYEHRWDVLSADTNQPLILRLYFLNAAGAARDGVFRVDDLRVFAVEDIPEVEAIIYTFATIDLDENLRNFPQIDDVFAFNGEPMSYNNNLFGTTGFSSSNASNYPWASGALNWFSSSMRASSDVNDQTPYLEFTAIPLPGLSVRLAEFGFGARVLGSTVPAEKVGSGAAGWPGPERYEIRSSLDGFSTAVASGVFPTNRDAGWYWYAHGFGEGLQAPTNQDLTLRIYFLDAGTGDRPGAFRIDDVTLISFPTTMMERWMAFFGEALQSLGMDFFDVAPYGRMYLSYWPFSWMANLDSWLWMAESVSHRASDGFYAFDFDLKTWVYWDFRAYPWFFRMDTRTWEHN